MTDREMLEMAAKAAGLNYDHRYGIVFGEDDCGNATEDGWNPLLDDGDAQRLAVALSFGVFVSRTRATSWVCDQTSTNIAEVLHDDAVNFDPCAATRRAIVRAAAEVGAGIRPFPTAEEIERDWT